MAAIGIAMDAKMETQRDNLIGRKIRTQYGIGQLFSSHMRSRQGLHFFGNKRLDLEKIQNFFPNKKLIVLRQTHSNHVVNFVDHPELPETDWTGDASISQEHHHVLIVKTADCVPLLFMSNTLDTHGAIHAGWRGVANRIFIEFLEQARDTLGHFDFGPHITQRNFEVDQDVAIEILKSLIVDRADCIAKLNETSGNEYCHRQGEKYYMHLVNILKQQCKSIGQKKHVLNDGLIEDVVEHLNYFSYRRDKECTGRNYSFSCLLEPQDMKFMQQHFLQECV